MPDPISTIVDMLDIGTRDRIAFFEERVHRTVSGFGERSLRLQSEAGINRELCRLLVEEAGYPLAWIGSVEPGDRLSLVASRGEDVVSLRCESDALGREPGSAARLARLLGDGTPRIVSLPLNPDSEAVPALGHGALALLPLSADQPPSRWLFVYADDPLSLASPVFRLLTELAHTATVTLERVVESTARMRAEDKAEVALLRWGSVISAAPIGLVAFSEDGRIALANDAAQHMAGIPASRAMGRLPSAMVRTTLDIDAIVAKVAREPGTWAGEGWMIVRGGKRLWARVSLAHGSLSPGRSGGIAVIVDATAEHLFGRHAEHGRRLLDRVRNEAAFAVDRERRDIAMGLHDTLGQTLAAIKINLGVIGATVADDEVRARVDLCRGLAEDAVAATRSFTYALYPPVLHGMGLNAALEWLVGKHNDEDETEWIYSGRDVDLDVDRAAVLYRVTSELMANVRKHSAARQASVELSSDADAIVVVVADDGSGFSHGAETRFGLGLSGVTIQLDRLDGTLEIESHAGQTRVRVTVPTDRRRHARKRKD